MGRRVKSGVILAILIIVIITAIKSPNIGRFQVRSLKRGKFFMCGKKQFEYCPSEIDSCMVGLINFLSRKNTSAYIETLGCCCGHGEYPMSVIVRNKHGLIYDLISLKVIDRKKRFYKKDKDGYYYIPEVSNE